MEEVNVTIVRAIGIVGNDGFGANKTSDPYAVLTYLNSNGDVIKGTTKKTKDIQKTVNPEWNETHVVGHDVDLRTITSLAVTIMDKNMMRDVPLGRAVVPMDVVRSALGTSTPLSVEYPIEKFDKVKIATGTLHLQFSSNAPAAVASDAPDDVAIEMTGPPNCLLITIDRATGLKAMDSGGTSDPLVIVSCQKEKFTTTTIQKTLTPVWNQSFRMPITDVTQEILFVVEDFDTLSNDLIGKVKLPMEAVAHGNKQTFDLRLLDKKFRPAEGLGTLTVTLHWVFKANIDEIVESNKKKKVGILDKVMNVVSGVPDANDLDEEGIDPDTKEVPKKSDEELKKEAEEKEKALQEEKKALEDINIKSGDYSIQVHVIEARDLVGKDATGTSDPVVFVDVLDQTQHTATKKQTLSAVWDDVLIFNFRELDKEIVEMGTVKLRVMDANTIQRAELIGETQFDTSFIYSHINHQICNQWLGLIAPGEESIQGYLRVSITIIGPGDKFVPPPPPGPGDSGVDGVMMPPSIKQDVNFLVATVHVGEHLVPMDSVLGGFKQGLDAYVEICLGSNDAIRTRVKTKKGERHLLNPAFNDELWMVLREPGLANNITIAVKDWDKLGKDEVVAHSYQSLRLIKKLIEKSGSASPQWLNLYGAPIDGVKGNILGSSESVESQMNKYPDTASFFRGRILVTFEIRANDANLEECNRRVKATPLPKTLYPPTSVYRIRAFVGTGSDIPQITSLNIAKKSRMQIIISCGSQNLLFERQQNNKGLVVWNELKESDNLVFPSDPDQIPDVFVYLCKGSAGDKMNPLKQISFKRYKAKDLLNENMTKEPAWVTLKEDPCIDALDSDEFPGNILLALSMGNEDVANKTRQTWTERFDKAMLEKRHKYQVQVNLFQGRHLPALDDNGLSDPYAKIVLCGEKKVSKVQKRTRDPMWYEIHTFDVELPPVEMLHFSPQVIIRLMDHDNGIGESGHDYMGSAFVSFNASNIRDIDDPRPLPPPEWYKLMQQEEGDTDGAILASIVVVKMDMPDMVLPVPRPIHPKMRKAYIEIIILGLRDMRPYQFLPIQLPFLEFTLGGKVHASQEMKTEKSKRPSAQNPNFLQRIVREVELPEDPLFTPMLNIMVRDTRLGGWSTPTIGNASIDMTTKLPWGAGYIPPQRMSFSHVEDEDDIGNDDDDADEVAPMLKGQRTAAGDIGAGVFGALESMNVAIDLDDPALLSNERKVADGVAAGAEDIEEEAADEFEIKRRKFMKNREDLTDDLESVLPNKPFETYGLTIGQRKKKSSFFSSLFGSKKAAVPVDTGTFHVAGIFKGLVRVMLDENEPALIDMAKLLNPLPYQVRVYVLNGTNFSPMDPSLDGTPGKSDPYLILRLGKEKINDRKNYIDDVVDPDFYKVFEFNTHFPGASTLQIDAFDHDLIGGDDLIGSTKLDLEDRFFDKNWQKMGRDFQTTERWGPKPVEQRTLLIPTSKAPMGQLRLWVDILTPKEAANYPLVDIAMPPAQHFELRVVIWKTKEVPSFDEITDMNDLFVRCSLEGCDYQDTDIHWRAKKGKASFNWRMKFPVALGHKQHNSKFPYFKLQMWDKDIFSANDCIAEGILDLSTHFKKVCLTKSSLQIFQDKKPKKDKESANQARDNDAIRSIKEATGLWDTNPTDSHWVKMERHNRDTNVKEPMGAVCISMEIVPIDKAKIQTVGFGRSDPNNSPFLPPPTGRLKFNLPPCYVLLVLFAFHGIDVLPRTIYQYLDRLIQALSRDFVDDKPKKSSSSTTSLSSLRSLQLFRASYATSNSTFAIQIHIGYKGIEYLQVASYLTITNVKVLIFKEYGIPFEEQTLFYQGVLLEGTEELAQVGLSEGSTVYVVSKKRYRSIGAATSTVKSVVLSSHNSEGFEIVEIIAPLPPFRIVVQRIMLVMQYLRRLDQMQEEHSKKFIWTLQPTLSVPDANLIVANVFGHHNAQSAVTLTALRQAMKIHHDLRSQSEIRTIKKWLAGVKYFFDCSLPNASLNDLARHIVYASYQPGSFVFREGEVGDSFFIVLSGSVNIAASGQGLFAVMRPGMCFGEIGLLRGSSGNRSGSALVNYDVQYTELALEVYLRSILSFKQAMLADNERYIGKFPMFRCIPKEATTHLAYLSDAQVLDFQQILLSKGDRVDHLYLLVKGKVKLTITKTVEVTVLGKPIDKQIKVIVLRHAPAILGHEVCGAAKGLGSMATIEALSPSRLLSFNKSALLRFVFCNHGLMKAIQADEENLNAEITRRLDTARDHVKTQTEQTFSSNVEMSALDDFFASALSTAKRIPNGVNSLNSGSSTSSTLNAVLSPRTTAKRRNSSLMKSSFTTAFSKICKEHWHETLPHRDILTYEEQIKYSTKPNDTLSENELLTKLECLLQGLRRIPPVDMKMNEVVKNDGNDQYTFLEA
ncbi:hypothetical protein THRCLA_07103 [Thraustotheca clavata]|uniref:Calmodulin n=1 Tax=Thraustotheca clavata TaxID=74557 RepID=A0A1V9ZGD1_9STRA|nr:hypothetical protein THRCLA_07103 [Thraustotheca clavata]